MQRPPDAPPHDSKIDALCAEIDESRRLLARLRADYETVDRSKFSALRSLWLLLKRIFGAASPADVFFTKSWRTAPHTATAPNPAAVAGAFAARMRGQSATATPLVSIIIPVFNHCDATLRCLDSIARTWFATLAVEIIVVDDASTDETAEMLSAIPGVRVIRNESNAGFIRSSNRGAQAAHGKYLCFLNNDTEVTEAWLDHLVTRAESDERIGAVGAKLVYPDGRLQEAGNILWRDGSGWNYGRFEDPRDPYYNFARETDYCSGACLLVRRDAFERAGRFSEAYLPAYYEDADLCLTLRERGYRVMYEPRSTVIHWEGVTSGTDLSAGVKRHQERNRTIFRKRWASQLDRRPENDARNVYDAARSAGSERTPVAIIDSYVPMYDKEAGSHRLLHIVKILREAGHRIVFIPDNFAALEPYTTLLQQLGVEVVYHGGGAYDVQQRANDALRSARVAWICRPELFSKWAPVARNAARCALIYDTVDLHYVRLKRQAEFDASCAPGEWQRLRDLELSCARSADVTITVTSEEREALESEGIERICVVPTIHEPAIASRAGRQRSGVLFIGGYNHAPNADCALRLVRDVMPKVWRELPDAEVTLIGANPPDELLSVQSRLVRVPGFVADLEPYFAQCCVFAAPLRFGAGHKGKIGLSLANGLPVITSEVGAEGYHLRSGLNCFIASSDEEFASAIVRLHRDPKLHETIARHGLEAVERFTPQRVSESVLAAIARTLQSTTAPA